MTTIRRESMDAQLYEINEKTLTFTKLDLSAAEQIRKCGNENRLAVVIKTGTEVFAHLSPLMAKRFEERPLSINGAKAVVKVLSQEECDELAKVGEVAQELQIIPTPVEPDLTVVPQRASKSMSLAAFSHAVRTFLHKMEKVPHKIVMALLIKWQENVIIEKKRAEEKARRDEMKGDDIERNELKRDRRHQEIKNEEIH